MFTDLDNCAIHNEKFTQHLIVFVNCPNSIILRSNDVKEQSVVSTEMIKMVYSIGVHCSNEAHVLSYPTRNISVTGLRSQRIK